jgi:putative exporter of polyketide antibiotics
LPLTQHAERVGGAFFGEWVICVIIIGAGFGLTGFIRGRAVAILSGLVVVSYLAELLHEALKLPGWLLDLSIFHQYGQPIVNNLNWLPQLIMLVLGLSFILAGGFGFWRRDIVK